MGLYARLPAFISFGIPSVLWWMGIAAGVRSAGSMTVIFLAIYVSDDVGLPLSVAGIVLGCFGVGSVVGSLLSGRLSDRVGCKTTLVFSLLAEGIVFALLLLNRSPIYVGVVVGLMGLFDGAFRPAYNGIVMRICSTGEMRSMSYSWYLVMTNIGYIVAAMVGGFLSGISFSLLLVANAFTCLFVAGLLVWLVPVSANERASQALNQMHRSISGHMLHDRAFLTVLLAAFATALVHGQLLSSVPVYLQKVLLFDDATIGWIFAANGALLVVLQMHVTSMAKAMPSSKACALGSVLLGLPFLALMPHDSFLFLCAFLLLFTLGEMILWPALTSVVMTMSEGRERPGEYIGMYHAVFGVSHVFAAPLGLGLYGMSGSSAVWLMCGLIGLLCAALFLISPASS